MLFKLNLFRRASDGDEATRHLHLQSQACLEALPIWVGQIQAVRTQTEEAIAALSERFNGIVERINTALGVEDQLEKKNGIRQDAEEGAAQLSQVIQALRAIQQSRDEIARDIQGLVGYTRELQKMSADVEDIAFQTNMLALNAAIEAAHAGQSGRGFAVVAQQVRALSAAARDTGKRITDKVKLINDALVETGERNERVTSDDRKAVEASENHIRDVLHRFQERSERLADVALRASQDGAVIKEEVSDSLVQLQFQDRTGQILNQVAASMTELQSIRADTVADANVREQAKGYVEQMARHYTTQEQHQIHQGVEVQAAAPQEVTFF